MLKKTITYTDFNGDEVREDYYFHLSAADLVELEVSKDGGMAAWIQRIPTLTNQSEVVAEFKKLILMSYGKKSPDGKRFIRSKELCDEFTQTPAYSKLFMTLCTDATVAAEFFNGVIPQDMEEQMAQLTVKTPVVPESLIAKQRTITKTEAMGINSEELSHLIAEGATIVNDPTL